MLWLKHNHSRLVSSGVIVHNDLTIKLHLHCKPVRNAKPHSSYFAFRRIMGLVITVAATILYILFFSLFKCGLCTHRYTVAGNFSSVLLFVLFRSMGNAFHRKEELTVQRSKSACCEVSLIYSFILYIWCPHFSHLLGLSHLQVLSLSSSWRSLQYSSVCLQEHRQVAGSCTNKRFLLSEHWSQHGSQTFSFFSVTSFFNLHSHALCSVKLMKISFFCLLGLILLISIVTL